ncbi:MAG: cytochrome b [Legionella sp.]
MDDKHSSYSSVAKFLHWLIAIMVLCMLVFGFQLDKLPKLYAATAYMVHKSIGLTLLGLMIFRVSWIYFRGRPKLPATTPTWQIIAARTVQYGLYVALIVMPISGWVLSMAANHPPSYFGLFQVSLPIAPNSYLEQLMDKLHVLIAWFIIVLLGLHVSGAFKHYFIDKDRVVQSMLPGK